MSIKDAESRSTSASTPIDARKAFVRPGDDKGQDHQAKVPCVRFDSGGLKRRVAERPTGMRKGSGPSLDGGRMAVAGTSRRYLSRSKFAVIRNTAFST